ncbi:hypothetical protein JXC34_03010 [Candidatus Woesearchaeota archaeon]|nr:hypothetical protein [Candidatus Woesearchaeota archaeon]
MEDVDVKEYSWIVRGKQRRDIIRHIDSLETPTQISQKAKYSLNHTSRVLNEFREHGIVKLVNPDQKTGRLYTLTQKGKLIRDKLREKTS